MSSLLPPRKNLLLALGVGISISLILLALEFPASPIPLTLATILLFSTILVYVLFSHESVKLLREQTARQELVFVDFGLDLDEGGNILVWAANLGTSSFLVSEIEIRTQEMGAAQRCQVNTIVPAGQFKNKIPFDDRIFHALRSDAFVHFDISLKCRGLAENHRTPWKGFTIERRPHRQLEEGFTGLWGVACPECDRFDFMGMKTEGLPDLDAAWRRQAELEADLRASCPFHRSALLLESKNVPKQLIGSFLRPASNFR